jgi:Na+-driven multidrug efflux pump
MIDKSVIAIAYMWLYKLIIPLSTYSLLAMEVIKNFERLVFVPVHALAQVTNSLLSNNLGENNLIAAWQNLRRILFAAVFVVSVLLLLLACNAKQLVAIFDPQNLFRDEATFILRCVSGLVVLDACQVIFAAALRTLGYVRTVMLTRALFFLLLYLPVSLLINALPLASGQSKLLVFYGSFYLTIAMIGVYFLFKVSELLTPSEI